MSNPAFDISDVFGSSVEQLDAAVAAFIRRIRCLTSVLPPSFVATMQNVMTSMHATDLFSFCGFEAMPPSLRINVHKLPQPVHLPAVLKCEAPEPAI